MPIPAKIPRRDRDPIEPQTETPRPSLALRTRVRLTVSERLLPLIFFVVPGITRSNLGQINVFPVKNHLSNNALITVDFVPFDNKIFSKDQSS